ncbi:MAG TPA: hypothetical protein VML96_09630 [Egibacteraceae bacterium]|nr:hypothetical protein [Egibacteraceae bacterium]
MADWMTIRIVLLGGTGEELEDPPGRILVVSTDHSFLDLAEAVDSAFARWDLTPLHEFEVEGRRLALGGDPDDPECEDSEQVTLGEVGLRVGSRFVYIFDLGERWTHECTVTATEVDPFEVYGEEPDLPAPIFGWGTIPDQYGRLTEEEDDEDDEDAAEQPRFDDLDTEPSWSDDEADESSWDIVAGALDGGEGPPPDAELAAAIERLRDPSCADDWACDSLWTAAGLDPEDAPDDPERLWVELAAGIVAASEDGDGLSPETGAALALMEPADWAGAVIMLVRRGVGQSAAPSELLELIAACPEVESDELRDDEEEALLAALETIAALWQRLGALDASLSLTELGRWGLPESLRVAWTRA